MNLIDPEHAEQRATTAPTPPSPSPAEVEAAVRTLMRAWSPDTPLPGDARPADDGEEEYDPYEGCGCAGEDPDTGEPRGCNCGDGCSCESCDYYRYARAKTCQAGPHTTGLDTHCSAPTQYKVVGWRMSDNWTSTSDLAECTHAPELGCPCTGGVVFTRLGPTPRTHQTLTACSIEHAQSLTARMQQVYAEPDDQPDRLRWYIERWTYTPHDSELPNPLPALRECTRSARTCTSAAIDAITRRGDVDMWLRYVRQDLARAAWHAAKPLDDPDADDAWDDEVPRPVQDVPDAHDEPETDPLGGTW